MNSNKYGWLEKLEQSFLGLFSGTWHRRFCVLTNVGLLYFADTLDTPTDLFPVINCKIDKI